MKNTINAINASSIRTTVDNFIKLVSFLNDPEFADTSVDDLVGDVDIPELCKFGVYFYDEEEGYIPVTSIDEIDRLDDSPSIAIRTEDWFGGDSHYGFRDKLEVRPKEAQIGETVIRFLSVSLKEE